jgi:cytidine deaminase
LYGSLCGAVNAHRRDNLAFAGCRYNGAARPSAMTIAPATLAELKRRARDAAAHAYAPYSRFPVGAAVLAADGTMHAGANVENASYGLSICAERAAIFQAVAQGARRIEAIAVYTPTPAAATPCGACRQVIHEFGPDVLVVCCTDDERAERHYALAELLPEAFGPDHLA